MDLHPFPEDTYLPQAQQQQPWLENKRKSCERIHTVHYPILLTGRTEPCLFLPEREDPRAFVCPEEAQAAWLWRTQTSQMNFALFFHYLPACCLPVVGKEV